VQILKKNNLLYLFVALIILGILFSGCIEPKKGSDTTSPQSNQSGVCQCGSTFYIPNSDIVFFSNAPNIISKIDFNLSLSPGSPPKDMSKVTFTLSTKNSSKTVTYRDPSVNLTWITPQSKENTTLLINEIVEVGLNLEIMGYDTSSTGPNQEYTIDITPDVGAINHLHGQIPSKLVAGKNTSAKVTSQI
jgi:archaellin